MYNKGFNVLGRVLVNGLRVEVLFLAFGVRVYYFGHSDMYLLCID